MQLSASYPSLCCFCCRSGHDLQDLQLLCVVNGEIRQHGHTRDMLHDVGSLLAYVRERFPVAPGDIVLTGTPHGVSRIQGGKCGMGVCVEQDDRERRMACPGSRAVIV